MHRFFAEKVGADTVRLDPEDARHAQRVLRLADGDTIAVICGGALYSASLQDGGMARILSPLLSPEPGTRVTLYQGIAKGDRMDYIAQKCTEAGVCGIRPVRMARCVGEADETKRGRWQRIAREAAKQSGRAVVPVIGAALTFSEMLNCLPLHEQILVPWEEGGASLRSVYAGAHDVALVIGPEGGMDRLEVERMLAKGAVPVTLGPRIFRTETAGLAAIVGILLLAGDMEQALP
jgi:16S rRNA (uracil1498-N3)-methyltransferase